MRARWLTFVIVGVVGALAGGLVLGAWAAARRTHSATARFAEVERPVDISGPVAPGDESVWNKIADDPAVADATILTARAVISDRDLESGGFTFWGVDDTNRFGTSMMRPLLLRGRLANPDAAHEIVLHETFAREWKLDVGDTLTLHSFVGGTFANALQTGEFAPNGPTIELRIVGVIRTIEDVVGNGGVIVNALTPAFGRTYSEIDHFVQLGMLRLRGGLEAAPAFIERMQPVLAEGQPGSGLTDSTSIGTSEVNANLNDALAVAERGLLAFALIGAVALALTLVLVLLRIQTPHDHETLSALGMSRRSVRAGKAIPLAVTGAVMAIGSAALSYGGARSLMPALSRRADPDFGPRLDASVVAAAVVAGIGVVAAGALLGSRRTHAATGQGIAPISVGGAAVLLGTSLGRTNRVGRPRLAWGAVAGAVLALAGVISASIYLAGLSDLKSHHARWGLDADFTMPSEVGDRLSEITDVDATALLHFGFATIGDAPVHTVAFEPLEGSIRPEVLHGRLPLADDEVALSHGFFAKGLRIGSTIRAVGAEGAPLEYRVVGEAIAPQVDSRGSITNGAIVTTTSLDRLLVEQRDKYIAVRLTPGADVDAALQRLADVPFVAPVEYPASIANLAATRPVVHALVGLLGFLGLTGSGFALAGALRRGRRNLAIARSLGMTRRSVRTAVAAFVSEIVVVGAIMAVAAGCLVGTTLWRAQSDRMGVRTVVTIPWMLVILTATIGALGAVTTGTAVGNWYGQRRTIEHLRAE